MLEVLYEDNHIIAINKQGSVLVQSDRTGDKPLSELVKEYLKEKYQKPGNVFVGTVHRLDRPVSGVILFAKTSKAMERLNEMFKTREVNKTYWAIVRKKPEMPEGTLIHFLVKNPETNVTTAHEHQVPGSMRSVLSYKLIGEMDGYCLLEVYPITGRPHQIRVQLASMGCPIRGDKKYGYHKPNSNQCINLHARKISFIHPVKKEPVEIVADVPNDGFWPKFLAMFRQDRTNFSIKTD